MIPGHSFTSLAANYGGVLVMPDCEVTGLSIDSRSMRCGEAFVALRGDRFDGHDFVPHAIASGASGLVVERMIRSTQVPQWVVGNSKLALGQVARDVRTTSKAAMVGITGSTGKTTVKEMVAAICSQAGEVLATRGNLNNEIGVPLTLLGLEARHEFGVIEMGAAQRGDIGYLGQIVVPDVAVVTNIGVAHLGRFGSQRNIVLAKGEIYESLGEDGIAVINLDTSGADYFLDISPKRQVTFSSRLDCGASVYPKQIRLTGKGSEFTLCTPQGEIDIQLGLLGQGNLENALAAAGVATALEISLEQIKRGLELVTPVAGRLNRLVGLHGAVLIDDSYNANPVSVRTAIEVLASMESPALSRRVLVLGDMGELGDEAQAMHAEIGGFAKSAGVDFLLSIGPLASESAKAFGGNARSFDLLDELTEFAQSEMHSGDVWLIKGSRFIGLDKLVSKLTKSEGSSCSSG